MGVQDFLSVYYGRYGGADNPIARILQSKHGAQGAYQEKLAQGQENTLRAVADYIQGTAKGSNAPKPSLMGGNSSSITQLSPTSPGPAVDAVQKQAANPLSSALAPANPMISMQPQAHQDPMAAITGTPSASASPSAAPAQAGQNTLGSKAVALAKTALGTQYKWGGATLNGASSALDCSGLAQQVYKRLGINLPRTTYQQVKSGKAVGGIANAQPGDLIFYNSSSDPNGIGTNSHVAIYAGNGQMVEAYKTGYPVRVTPVRTSNLSTVVRPY